MESTLFEGALFRGSTPTGQVHWTAYELCTKSLQTMNLRLVDREHTGGTWVYSRHTMKNGFSTRKKRRQLRKGQETESNLDFLLTAGHTSSLAASVFGSPALCRVSYSGKRGGEVKRISGRGWLRRRVVGGQIMTRG